MKILLQLRKKYNIPVWFEPTDFTIACKPLQLESLTKIDYVSPNFHELRRIAEYVTKRPAKKNTIDVNSDIDSVVREARELALSILTIFPNVIVTLGKHGVLTVKYDEALDNRKLMFYHTETIDSVVNASGAGDCLAAGYIVAMLQGLSEPESVSYGLSAAVQSLRTKQTVPSTLRYEPLKKPLKYVELPVTGDFNISGRR